MDQNTPRDGASGAQPPADPASSDASAWNQQEQAAASDPSQAAAGGPQEAQAEHAAWSADASYQQQQQQQQAAAQGQPAQQADTQAYAAPEPQSATYSEQPADQQAYAQQQQPQQQAYDQQAYDQQAYAQQQQQAQQQQPQQQTYDQQAYDQQAYAQQQQAYAQQQQQQPQQQAYDQQAYQQQYYDQSAYGQQPSYYDQQAYAQQQYQQQPGSQQPTQPYAYGQPVQQQPWPGEEPYWDQQATGYGRSTLAVLGAFVLLTWGLVFAIGGALILWTGALDIPTGISLSTAMEDVVDEFNKQAAGYGGILLILGIVHMIGAMGILAHRKWGRAFGIVLGLLGTIWGVALLISSITFDAGDVTVEGAFSGETPALGAAILVLASYLIVFLGMFMGRRHFRKKGVSS